ncbi:MAG TPA: hypothetical protein VGV91_14500 [Rubrobacter sp.]|nr:hypothetical protein [Rubrobacter sp.]
MLEGLHRMLIEPGSQAANFALRGETHDGVRVERIYLDESGPEHEIEILFRDLGRPDCLFGYGIEAVETPEVLSEARGSHTDLPSAAQMWAENVFVLFEEEVFASGCGLPRDCSSEAITWVGGRAPTGHDQGS